MYAMDATRQDIARATGVVSRLMGNPGKAHYETIKSIVRYLKGAISKYLHYQKVPLELQGFCDSDVVDDVDTHKPTSRYVFQ